MAIKQSLFCLAGHPSHSPLRTPLTLHSQVQPQQDQPPLFRIPLKLCHVSWRQSAEMFLRYSCSFSKSPKFNLWTHLLPCLSVTKREFHNQEHTSDLATAGRLAWPICTLLHGQSQPLHRGKRKHEQTKD